MSAELENILFGDSPEISPPEPSVDELAGILGFKEEPGFIKQSIYDVAGGVIDAGETYARAGRALPGGPETYDLDENSIFGKTIKWAENFKRDNPNYDHVDSEGLPRWWHEGLRSVTSSVIAGAPSAAAGAAIGGPLGAVVGFGLGAGTTFGLAEYDQFMQEAKQSGIKEDDAQKYAVLSAVAEGGFEGVTDILQGLTMGVTTPLTQPGKAALKQGVKQLFKTRITSVLKRQVGTGLLEGGSEVATAAVQTTLRNRVGLSEQDAMMAAGEAFGPAFVAGVIFGGFIEGGNIVNRKKIARALTDEKTDPEQRLAAASEVVKTLRQSDKRLAQIWEQSAQQAIARGEAIDLGLTPEELQGKIDNLRQNAKASPRAKENLDIFEEVQAQQTGEPVASQEDEIDTQILESGTPTPEDYSTVNRRIRNLKRYRKLTKNQQRQLETLQRVRADYERRLDASQEPNLEIGGNEQPQGVTMAGQDEPSILKEREIQTQSEQLIAQPEHEGAWASKDPEVDKRLLREDYRQNAPQFLASISFNELEQGRVGAAVGTDDLGRNGYRMPTANEPWVQETSAMVGGIDKLRNALNRAVAGEKLGKNQREAVKIVLDQYGKARTDALAPEVLEKRQQQKDTWRLTKYKPGDVLPPPPAYTEPAFEDTEYHSEWDTESRQISDLYSQASAIDKVAADDIIGSVSDDNGQVAAALWQFIKENENGRESQGDSGLGQREPQPAERAQKTAAPDQPAEGTTQEVAPEPDGQNKLFATPPTFGKKAQPQSRATNDDLQFDQLQQDAKQGDLLTPQTTSQQPTGKETNDLSELSKPGAEAQQEVQGVRAQEQGVTQPADLSSADPASKAGEGAAVEELASFTEYGTVKEQRGSNAQVEFNFDLPADHGKNSGRQQPAGSGDLQPAGRVSLYRRKGLPPTPRNIAASLETQVDRVQTGTFKIGLKKILSAADAAHVFAPLRKYAKENFAVLVLDKGNQPLAVLDISTGSTTASIVHPRIVAGAALDVPGAASVWLAHNHPSGNPAPSQEDKEITARLEDLLRGSGVEIAGSVIVGKNGEFTNIGRTNVPRKPTIARRNLDIPKMDDRLARNPTGEARAISSAGDAATLFATQGYANRVDGVLLLNAKNEPVGWVEMTTAEMKLLRTGSKEKGSGLLSRALSQSNAVAFVVRMKRSAPRSPLAGSVEAATNMANFAALNGSRMLDVITDDGKGAFVSLGDQGLLPSGGGVMYSRKTGQNAAEGDPQSPGIRYGTAPDSTDAPKITIAQVQSEVRDFLKKGYDNLTKLGKLKVVQSAEELGINHGKKTLFSKKTNTASEAFKKWFGDSKVVDENGEPLVVYHGTNKADHREAPTDKGFFVTSSKEMANSYTNTRISQLRDMKTRATTTEGKIKSYEKQAKRAVFPVYIKLENPFIWGNGVDRDLSKPWADLHQAWNFETNSKEGVFYKMLGRPSLEQLQEAFSRIRGQKQPKSTVAAMEMLLRMQGVYGGRTDAEYFIGAQGSEYLTKDLKIFLEGLGFDGIEFTDNIKTNYGVKFEEGKTYVAFFPTQIKSVYNKGAFDPENPNILYSKSGDVAGVYNDGTITLIADRMNKGDAEYLMRHEGLHMLMREDEVFSAKRDEILAQFKSLKEASKRVRDAYARVPEETKKGYLDEEALAYFVESKDNHNHSIVRKLIAAVKAWMLRHGIPVTKLTEADFVALVSQGVRSFASHGKPITDAMSSDVMQTQPLGKKTQEQQPDQEQLKSWFKKSKVANPDGSPKVVYHGTNAEFTVFQPSGRGIFFSDSKEVASNYTEQYRAEKSVNDGIVMPVYLSLQNPVEMTFDGGRSIASAVKEARDTGNDGVIVKNYPDSYGGKDSVADMYIVFEPTQIKSALGNGGAYDAKNPDILYSRRPVGGVGPARSVIEKAGPRVKNTIDYLRMKFQDKFIPLSRAQEVLQGQGWVKTTENDAYRAEEVFHEKATGRLEDFYNGKAEPLVKKIEESSVSVDELEDYLYARFAPQRNAYIASINEDMPDGGSGWTNKKARDILDKFDAEGKTAELELLAADVRDITKMQRDIIRSEGLELDETMDAWELSNPDYIPLKGGKESRGKGIGTGYNVKRSGTKKALGRRSEATALLAHLFDQAGATIVRAEKAKVGRAFLKMVEENPNPELWKVYDPKRPETLPTSRKLTDNPEVKRIKKKLDRRNYALNRATEQRTISKLQEEIFALKMELMGTRDKVVRDILDARLLTGDNVMAVTREDGTVVYIDIIDDDLARVMKNLTPNQYGKVTKALGTATRYLSRMSTIFNPEFVVTNFERDIQTAMVNLSGEHNTKLAKEVLKGVPGAWKGIHDALKGKDSGSDWSQWFVRYKRAGAQVSFMDLRGVEHWQAKLKKLSDKDGIITATKGKIAQVGNLIDRMNGATENAVRLSAFRKGIEAGMSESDAASLAKNLTVNFNRKGELGPAMNALYMFANAGVQGSARMFGALKHKRVRKMMGTVAVMAFGLAEMNRLVGGDDDDGENKWDKVSDFEKQVNFVFKTGDGEFKIRLPYGYNVFVAAGYALSDIFHYAQGDGGKSPVQVARFMQAAIMNAFNPLGGDEGILKIMAPTLADPLVEIATNENFMGSKIMPENFPFGAQKPDSQLYFRNVSAPSKVVAEFLNEITGGSKWESGAVDISPETIDHYFDFVLGGLGRTIRRTANVPALALEDSLKIKDIPFIRQVYQEASPQVDQSRFYDNLKSIAASRAALKEMPLADKREYRIKHPEARLYRLANSYRRSLSNLRKRRYALLDAGNNEAAKRAEEQMQKVAKRFNGIYNARTD